MSKRCTPCIGSEVKSAIRSIGDNTLNNLMSNIPDCPGSKTIQVCGVGKGTSPRSPYQEFISTCMKGKNIKGFGEAPKAMKECAGDWRAKRAAQQR